MHLKCPRKSCQHIFDTKDRTRFSLFKCEKCSNVFRGIHCEPARRYYLFDWVNPFSTACFHNWDHTACPHCGVMLRINYSHEHTGFDGPSVCKACTRDLPTWESDHGDGAVYSARPRYPMR